MKITFLGAAHEVTGSCHYLEIGSKKAVVDCGMEQGADLYVNQEIPVNPSELDYVFVTHAHIDHSGMIPLLYKNGFKGEIYATNATTELCRIMLKDSAHIQEQEAEWKNRKAQRAGNALVEPMYTVEDAEQSLAYFVPCPYNKEIELCEEITICFRDAGHLLGSSFIEILAKEEGVSKKLVFSGDLGYPGRTLIKDPEVPKDADFLIIESTYGDRLHELPPDYAAELAGVIRDAFSKGGNVVIPAFSVGRTQEMLYHLRRIKQENMLPEFAGFEVYVDSPLSVEATRIFNKSVLECFRPEDAALIEKGINPIGFDGLNTSVTTDDSRAINFLSHPAVIISASGMCEAGRIRHHLKHNLWRKECCVVFVGYQVPGTLGHALLNGAEEVKLFGEKVRVEAKIINLPGISGHGDKNHLTDWVRQIEKKPERIFVVHGEDTVTDNFAAHLTEEIGIPAIAPYSGDSYDLVQNVCIAQGDRKRVIKKTVSQTPKAPLARLLAAAQRLLEIAKSSGELANKDQKKFAEQLEALCDKWDVKKEKRQKK